MAYDRETAEVAWTENAADEPVSDPSAVERGLYGSLDDVDFESEVVAVWWGTTSAGCPGYLANVTTGRDGRVAIETDTEYETNWWGGHGCGANLGFYRMIVAVERDRLPAPDELPTDNVDRGSGGYKHNGRTTVVSTYPWEGDL